LKLSAKAMAYFDACLEYSEKSVGSRIFLISSMPCLLLDAVYEVVVFEPTTEPGLPIPKIGFA
jgi:hypothetical protein